MKIAFVGGSGYVGSLVRPYFPAGFAVRILDVAAPPELCSAEYRCVSVAQEARLAGALEGAEALVYAAMGRGPDGLPALNDVDLSYDLQVKNLHRTLLLAHRAGIRRAVYLSSMSVYRFPDQALPLGEETPRDNPELYGFTKHLGELVCDYFARNFALETVALRLYNPMPLADWQACVRDGRLLMHTAAPDVARAILLALTAPLSGFHALNIAGDWQERLVCCRRAREVLGWGPRCRPETADCPDLFLADWAGDRGATQALK